MAKKLFFLALIATFITGCAIFQPVKPEEALKHPLGTDSIKIGMTKDQVKSIIGDPDSINPIARTNDVLTQEREEWVYRGRYSRSPLKADYFGKTMSLFFDGDNLTSYTNSK